MLAQNFNSATKLFGNGLFSVSGSACLNKNFFDKMIFFPHNFVLVQNLGSAFAPFLP